MHQYNIGKQTIFNPRERDHMRCRNKWQYYYLDSAQIDLILDYLALKVIQLFQNQRWLRYTHGKIWKSPQNVQTLTPQAPWQQPGETSSSGHCVRHHLYLLPTPCQAPAAPSQAQHSLRGSGLPATSACLTWKFSLVQLFSPFFHPNKEKHTVSLLSHLITTTRLWWPMQHEQNHRDSVVYTSGSILA